MSESSPKGEGVFDLDRLHQLVELMKEHDLARLDLRQGDDRIQLQRGSLSVEPAAVMQPIATATAGAAKPAEASSPPPAEDDRNIAFIKSPMVGTFYSKPNPESENFAKVGDLVTPETTVCIVEAMKVFNEIPAEISGRIVAVLVENEEPIEFGKPLFKVNTDG